MIATAAVFKINENNLVANLHLELEALPIRLLLSLFTCKSKQKLQAILENSFEGVVLENFTGYNLQCLLDHASNLVLVSFDPYCWRFLQKMVSFSMYDDD